MNVDTTSPDVGGDQYSAKRGSHIGVSESLVLQIARARELQSNSRRTRSEFAHDSISLLLRHITYRLPDEKRIPHCISFKFKIWSHNRSSPISQKHMTKTLPNSPCIQVTVKLFSLIFSVNQSAFRFVLTKMTAWVMVKVSYRSNKLKGEGAK